jgi:hypothetical protein
MMLKKYMQMSGRMILFFLLYLVPLMPLFLIRDQLEQKQLLLALGVWVGCGVLLFLPTLGMIIRKSWFFDGQGEPIVQDLLLAMLTGINDMNGPVQVHRHHGRLVFSFRCNDPGWLERMELGGLNKAYELTLRLDHSTRTVIMTDRFRSLHWKLSGGKAQTGFFAWPRPFFKVDLGEEWGIENYEQARPEAYEFTPREIKSPILNTILRNGWNVRFSLFR